MIKTYAKKATPVLVIILACLIYLIMQLTATQAETTERIEPSWLVHSQTIEFETLNPVLNLLGQVESPALVTAVAPKKSYVTDLRVKEGQTVENGQLLLKLDQRDFQPRLAQARSQAEELKAIIDSEQIRFRSDKKALKLEQSVLELEQKALRRASQLKTKNLGSSADLEQAQKELDKQRLTYINRQLSLDDFQARLRQLESRLDFALAEVELAELDLERSRIIAPFAAIIEKTSVSTGDSVSENQELLSFYSLNDLEIRAKIPSLHLTKIQQTLSHQAALTAQVQSYQQITSLRLNRLSGVIDQGGMDALFEIESDQHYFRPGQSIAIQLKLPEEPHVIALPYSAIYENNRIYRIVNQRLQALTINIVGDYPDANNHRVIIRHPELKSGDQILLTHLPNAISGLKVEIHADKL